MEIYRRLEEIPYIESGALTIGKFDSMHIAHRKVLSQTHQIAIDEKKKFIVISFSNHPFDVLNPKISPYHLSNEKFKISFLEDIGCDVLILLNFTSELMNISHIDFIKFLNNRIKNIHFILGYNFKFGANNLGDIEYLKKYCSEDNNIAKLTVIEKVEAEKGVSVSSSLIRELLQKGSIEKANEFLEREYYIESQIRKGEQLGRTIGFPTINMYSDEIEYPKNGVYLTRVEVDGIEPDNKTYSGYGMTYVGKRMILGFKETKTLIETYIFNFDKNIYDKVSRIYFLYRIRDVMEFDSFESLKKQLKKDYNMCIKILEERCH